MLGLARGLIWPELWNLADNWLILGIYAGIAEFAELLEMLMKKLIDR